MAFTKEVENVWEEFDHDFYRIAEAVVDLRAELEKKQKEIDDHVCETICPLPHRTK